ncbi:MAG: helix-turn-helix domain-containing protein [Chloroflexi bacterium]|nr:helix-turn-helix domain-containing protein [Chloroflexota bacterium]
MAGPAPDDWVTAAEAADALGVSVLRVRRWARAGRFPRVWQDGKRRRTDAHRYRFGDVAAVEAAVRRHAERSASCGVT